MQKLSKQTVHWAHHTVYLSSNIFWNGSTTLACICARKSLIQNYWLYIGVIQLSHNVCIICFCLFHFLLLFLCCARYSQVRVKPHSYTQQQVSPISDNHDRWGMTMLHIVLQPHTQISPLLMQTFSCNFHITTNFSGVCLM